MELSQTLAQPINLLHYSLYVHNLQVDLESSGLGARVGDTYTGGPTYAEDIPRGAAKHASHCSKLCTSMEINTSLHLDKTEAMVFGCRHSHY